LSISSSAASVPVTASFMVATSMVIAPVMGEDQVQE
jgi:hypothetical protein